VVSPIKGRAAIAVVVAVSKDGEVTKNLLAMDANTVRLACRFPDPRSIPVVGDGVGRKAQTIPGQLRAP
jgi:hypothetical protein